MADNLSSGGSSDFLEARKYFYPKEQRAIERIEVFVEDEVDTVFWRCLFDELNSNKIFIIRVLRTTDELNGKDALISKIGLSSLGPNKLIAIDSDYDYIIDDYHDYTSELRACQYVLHTIETYSIENFKIGPLLLRRAIYMCSFCDNITEDIEKMLYDFSILYYQLFTMHLYLTSKHDNFYTQSKFKADLHKLIFNQDSISQKTLDYVSAKETIIRQHISQKHSEADYNSFITHIRRCGIIPDTSWQYMNGHDVLEKVAIKITQPISSKYRGEYIKWIHSHVSQDTRKQNLLNKFCNCTGIETSHKLRDRLIEIFYDFPLDFKTAPAQRTLSHISSILG